MQVVVDKTGEIKMFSDKEEGKWKEVSAEKSFQSRGHVCNEDGVIK